ncbi:hypothetical protein SDC9_130912 [bioreactor metagenome]|uniref:Uncharacterized protein n=1 Tax=bioreactor metagenome TaxID=1076179 RepID=A0A645D405_9ZZZZ
MPAFDAAHVTAGRHLLTAEAGGVGGKALRQGGLFQHFITIHAGEGNLGGGNHPQVFFNVVIQVVYKLGQLAGRVQGFGFDHEGGVAFFIALAVVQVQHERDEGTFQACAGTVEDIKAGTGQLDATVKINDAQFGAQFPMGQGFKVKILLLAFHTQNDILAVVLAVGGGGVGQVGHGRNQVVEPFFHFAHVLIQPGDIFTHLTHGFDLLLAFCCVFGLADGLGDGVAFRLKGLHAGQQRAPFAI